MHRRWISLPLLTSAVSAFYPYNDGGNHGDKERRHVLDHISTEQPNNNLVTADIRKVYHKRDNKFSVVLSNPASTANGLAISQDGADYSYFSTIGFGSTNKQLYMLIDTGSANTWVMGQSCTSKSCTAHNFFGPNDSNSLNATSKTWSLTYGTGTVSGVVVSDTVKFANFTFNMGFGMAAVASDDFNNYPMDGILGLGRATSNELGVPTVMENLKSQGKLTQNVLGVHLNRGADNTKDGEIVFGGVNPAKFTGTIVYTTTNNAGTWTIPVDDAYVNDRACGLTGKSAIIDTGTSYVLMPPSDAQKLHALIPGSVGSGETYTVPCDSKANIQISFSGVKYSISPKDYIGQMKTGNTCSSTIIGHQPFGPNDWILGDVFLKNVYTIFDFDQARIGLAMSASGGSAAGVPTMTGTTTSAASNTATSTGMSSGTSSSTASSASSTSSGTGNPFDASSSTPDKKNAALSLRQSYDLVLMIAVAFFIGLII